MSEVTTTPPAVPLKIWSYDDEFYMEVDLSEEVLYRMTPDTWEKMFEFEWDEDMLKRIVKALSDEQFKPLFDHLGDEFPDSFTAQMDWSDALKWLLWHRDFVYEKRNTELK